MKDNIPVWLIFMLILAIVIIFIVSGFTDKIPTYTYYEGADALSPSILQMTGTIPDYRNVCSSIPQCGGFTTKGFIKGELAPMDEWTHNPSDKTVGLFVKGYRNRYW